ncbi:Gfo/Idh/MocA family protein [Jeotgalibacillus haloalkalitolerans]|uniref:Gfo/Idh/MocA family oxidoreductase n=1 Tax=Jeotgalibacillus haloalkalitolerans TaxID=3104292 RepID=A0ABU5KKH6_9BACL|nr:Gfo/Idh/MocA family oxidoreductase [Jeotgalibacillus sp. HH7-29]MDZ5711446.1 Gfo/Idh/MocA family oxidoreductase [Jeotgalibacillus sp. HH7-29]
MSKLIKSAVIGTGFSAMAHLETLKRLPGVEAAGIVSRSAEKAKQIAREYRLEFAYGSIEELLSNPEIDVVHNCTPNVMHYELNKRILESGKHVLSEKPLALNSDQSLELLEIAEASGLINGVCFNYRHYPMVEEARSRIESGEFGRPHLISGGYLQDWCLYQSDYSWRMDPGLNGPSRAIADIGSHWCDTMQHVLGKRIVRVMADLTILHVERMKPAEGTGSTFSHERTAQYEKVSIHSEDAGNVLVQFEDGTKGMFTVSQVTAGKKNHLHFTISLSDAAFEWNQEEPNLLWIGRRNQSNQLLMKDAALLSQQAGAYAHFPGGHQEGWPDCLKNLMLSFYGKIARAEQTVSFATFEDGHYNMRIIDAILKSASERAWIDV